MKIHSYDHIDVNVTNLKKSSEFYDKLFAYFGFKKRIEKDWWYGWIGNDCSYWIKQTRKDYLKNTYNRENPGVNHIAFLAESKEDIDKFYQEFLLPNQVKVLYGGPAEYPEYTKDYYAVFFEDPDGFKLELMWFHTQTRTSYLSSQKGAK